MSMANGIKFIPQKEMSSLVMFLPPETAFNFTHFNDKLKSRIHTLAYQQGHSAGYVNIIIQYFDLMDLAHLAIDECPNMKQLQK